mmetsp:Transcript_22369/g.75296  ORF Transcript_22369/g.75296 Transcript_22369/m.75296 type:complete len:278 (-) Transcript_22369:211-1044(-)
MAGEDESARLALLALDLAGTSTLSRPSHDVVGHSLEYLESRMLPGAGSATLVQVAGHASLESPILAGGVAPFPDALGAEAHGPATTLVLASPNLRVETILGALARRERAQAAPSGKRFYHMRALAPERESADPWASAAAAATLSEIVLVLDPFQRHMGSVDAWSMLAILQRPRPTSCAAAPPFEIAMHPAGAQALRELMCECGECNVSAVSVVDSLNLPATASLLRPHVSPQHDEDPACAIERALSIVRQVLEEAVAQHHLQMSTGPAVQVATPHQF